MTNDLAEEISVMIIKIFPNEAKETYFSSPIKKKNSVTKKSVSSRGKLMAMWRNKQHKHKILQKTVLGEIPEDVRSVEKNDIYLHI